jgi:hypothetical protein
MPLHNSYVNKQALKFYTTALLSFPLKTWRALEPGSSVPVAYDAMVPGRHGVTAPGRHGGRAARRQGM